MKLHFDFTMGLYYNTACCNIRKYREMKEDKGKDI